MFDKTRREFIRFLGGAAVIWPSATRAQQPPTATIGFVHLASATFTATETAGFEQGLKETGYVNGQNLAIEYRWAEGQYDRLPSIIADLIGHRVELIAASGGPAPARAAMAATTTIPIIFVSATDPVAAGLVPSLNRPGGNVTGVSLIGSMLEAKRLGLLHQLVPNASRLGVLINPKYPGAKIQSQGVQEAAAHIGVKIIVLNTETGPEIETAFAKLAQEGAVAAAVAQDAGLFAVNRDHLVAVAAKHSVPTIYWQEEFATAGGLASYGPNFADAYRQAGIYAGRVLKGEKPADLPVVQPTKFKFVINLKTAKALGLEIPPTLLALADEVIE
jgi:putative tryptophan/tyrosine transport system substrate-binding protein